MATYSGRNASVKLGSQLIAELASWQITMSMEEIDTTVFGSTWGKSDVGFKKWTAKVDGFLDISDTSGQETMRTNFLGGSLISNIKFYVNANSYYTPDTTTDSSAGCRITSYEISQDKAGVAKVSFSLSGSGPITLV